MDNDNASSAWQQHAPGPSGNGRQVFTHQGLENQALNQGNFPPPFPSGQSVGGYPPAPHPSHTPENHVGYTPAPPQGQRMPWGGPSPGHMGGQNHPPGPPNPQQWGGDQHHVGVGRLPRPPAPLLRPPFPAPHHHWQQPPAASLPPLPPPGMPPPSLRAPSQPNTQGFHPPPPNHPANQWPPGQFGGSPGGSQQGQWNHPASANQFAQEDDQGTPLPPGSYSFVTPAPPHRSTNRGGFAPVNIKPYQSHRTRQPPRSPFGDHGNQERPPMPPMGDWGSQGDPLMKAPEEEEVGSEDQMWVKDWLKGLQIKNINAPKKKRPKVKISEARTMLANFLLALDQLSQVKQVMSECLKESNESKWASLCKEMEEKKIELSKLEAVVSDPVVIEDLRRQVERRKRKRERSRTRRQEEWAAREEALLRQKERVDASMTAALQAKQEKEQEEMLQKEVDGALSEVRRKKQDANRTMELLRALRKLRHLRKESAEKQGYVSPKELEARFEQKIKGLEEMMNKQKLLYVDEERALQVMLEEEHEETREKERQKKKARERRKAERLWGEQLQLLFGQTEHVEPGDRLFMFRHFFQQADSNLQSLVTIRRQWDAFIAPEGDPRGSSIPVSWVTPSKPANHIWATALEDPGGVS